MQSVSSPPVPQKPHAIHARHKPHPRVFVGLCGGTIFMALFLYTILILYPSYQSGISRSEDPSRAHFVVPFYSNHASGLVDTTTVVWTLYFIVDLFTLFFFPPLSLALLIMLLHHRKRFSIRERIFWGTATLMAWILFIATFSAAMKFGVWVAD